jgi:outer membrane lipoprotein-sorting protein
MSCWIDNISIHALMKFKIIHPFTYLVIAALALLTCSFIPTEGSETDAMTNDEVIKKMFMAMDNLKSLRYHLQCNERIKGRMQHTESRVKLQTSPRKLYLYIKGIEVLWCEGTNNGNALVNPGSFPYVNLNLDPNGTLMRKDQHHTINEMGYHYLKDIISDGLNKSADIDKNFILLGEEKYNGRMCYKLSISFPNFAWSSYTVKKAETFVSIARKFHVSEYMMLENNPKSSGYSDIKEGEVIKVPNYYSKLTLLLIDKEYMLPVNNKVFDDKGLFETYEYYDMEVNKPIDQREFTKNFEGYNF